MGVLVTASLFAGCDTGEFSGGSDDALVSSARSWFEAESADRESAGFTDGPLDAILARFQPDWSLGEVVEGLDGRQVVVTTLGEHAAAAYDTTGSILRTLIVEVDDAGGAVSGQIVEFVNLTAPSAVMDAHTLALAWLAGDYGESVMVVAEYDVGYVPIQAWGFAPGTGPIEMEVRLEECDPDGSSFKVMNNCYRTYLYSYTVCVNVEDPNGTQGSETIPGGEFCTRTYVYEMTCSDEPDGGGGGGSPGGPGGPGGSGGDGDGDGDSDPPDENDDEPEDPEPCDTGDPRIDDSQVQSLLDDMWALSNADARNVEDRRETIALLTPVGSGWQLQILPEHMYISREWDRASFGRRAGDSYPPGTVLVHTHPVLPSESIIDPRNGVPKKYSRDAGDEDRDALREHGIETGMIIDGGGIRFFSSDRMGTFGHQDRCGY